MSQGVPFVLSKTKIDSFYFDEQVVRFFPSGDVQAMADAMLEVIQNRELRDDLVARGLEYAARNDWSEKKKEYFELVDTLITEVFDTAGAAISANPESVSLPVSTSESDHKLVSK